MLAYGFLVFVLAGALVWAVLGAGLAAVVPVSWAVVLGIVGTLAYGGAQLLARGQVRVPERRWQVPSDWLHGRGTFARLTLWGATLGHGLLTRNPYASYWILVPALGMITRPLEAALVGALAGAAHGAGRFVGIVLRQRTARTVDWQLAAILWHLRFQRLDGVVLLLVGIPLAIMVTVAAAR